MDNGHSLAKLQILCAPPNVFAGILRAVGLFSPLASPYCGVFVAAAALWRPMCPRALPKVGSRLRERPLVRHTVGALPEKMGDFSEKTRENRRRSPRLFSKSPQWPSRCRPYTVRPFPLCRNRLGAVRAKTRAPPARLSVSALALRRNRGVPARLKRKPPCAIRRKSVILP